MAAFVKTRSNRVVKVKLQNPGLKYFGLNEIKRGGVLNGFIQAEVEKAFPVFPQPKFGKIRKLLLRNHPEEDDDDSEDGDVVAIFLQGVVAECCAGIKAGSVLVIERPFVELYGKQGKGGISLVGNKDKSDICMWSVSKKGIVHCLFTVEDSEYETDDEKECKTVDSVTEDSTEDDDDEATTSSVNSDWRTEVSSLYNLRSSNAKVSPQPSYALRNRKGLVQETSSSNVDSVTEGSSSESDEAVTRPGHSNKRTTISDTDVSKSIKAKPSPCSPYPLRNRKGVARDVPEGSSEESDEAVTCPGHSNKRTTISDTEVSKSIKAKPSPCSPYPLRDRKGVARDVCFDAGATTTGSKGKEKEADSGANLLVSASPQGDKGRQETSGESVASIIDETEIPGPGTHTRTLRPQAPTSCNPPVSTRMQQERDRSPPPSSPMPEVHYLRSGSKKRPSARDIILMEARTAATREKIAENSSHDNSMTDCDLSQELNSSTEDFVNEKQKISQTKQSIESPLVVKRKNRISRKLGPRAAPDVTGESSPVLGNPVTLTSWPSSAVSRPKDTRKNLVVMVEKIDLPGNKSCREMHERGSNERGIVRTETSTPESDSSYQKCVSDMMRKLPDDNAKMQQECNEVITEASALQDSEEMIPETPPECVRTTPSGTLISPRRRKHVDTIAKDGSPTKKAATGNGLQSPTTPQQQTVPLSQQSTPSGRFLPSRTSPRHTPTQQKKQTVPTVTDTKGQPDSSPHRILRSEGSPTTGSSNASPKRQPHKTPAGQRDKGNEQPSPSGTFLKQSSSPQKNHRSPNAKDADAGATGDDAGATGDHVGASGVNAGATGAGVGTIDDGTGAAPGVADQQYDRTRQITLNKGDGNQARTSEPDGQPGPSTSGVRIHPPTNTAQVRDKSSTTSQDAPPCGTTGSSSSHKASATGSFGGGGFTDTRIQPSTSSAPSAVPSSRSTTPQQYTVPPGYTKISDIQNQTVVSLYGVVKFFKPPWQSRGTDMCSVVVVVDPSTDDSLECVLFQPSATLLPQIQSVGDIVRLHRVKISMYKDRQQGKSSRGFAALVFGRNPKEVVSKETARVNTNSFTFADADKKTVENLKDFCASRLDLFPRTDQITVADIEKDTYFHIMCQVTGIAKHRSIDSMVLTITDGTAPQNEVAAFEEETYQVLVPAPSPLPHPSVDVFLFGDHAESVRRLNLDAGSIILLHSVHATVFRDGPGASLLDTVEPVLELCLHRGTDYGRGITVLQPNSPEVRPLLDRLA